MSDPNTNASEPNSAVPQSGAEGDAASPPQPTSGQRPPSFSPDGAAQQAAQAEQAKQAKQGKPAGSQQAEAQQARPQQSPASAVHTPQAQQAQTQSAQGQPVQPQQAHSPSAQQQAPQQPFQHGGQQPAPAQQHGSQQHELQQHVGQKGRPARVKAPKKEKNGQGLSTFLKVSIILLAGLTIASISLLFIGDFEGKFERVFSTFALFAVFVTFTALDTRRESKSEWYAPVALIANAYILGLLLIVIWMTAYDSFSLIWEIFWKSIFVILVTRLVILCCQLLLNMGAKLTEVVSRFAFVTSVLAVLSGILFTAPVGIAAFDLHIPDLYWKIATALLILTALGLSITLLLRWSLGADEREAARTARAQQAVQFAGQAPQVQHAQPMQHPQASTQHVPAPQQAQPSQVQAAQAPQPEQQLLPWPTFADGRPLPAGPDGQPDFSVLERPGN